MKVGEGGIHFRGRASYPTALVDWLGREMAKLPVDAVPRIGIGSALAVTSAFFLAGALLILALPDTSGKALEE